MKPKAILFDWDDTLVDTWHIVRNAINTTLVAMGHQAWSEEESRQRIGPPARVLFAQLFGEDKWQEADRIYLSAYEQNIKGNIRPHAHAQDILNHLSKHNIYSAVVSAKRGFMLRKEAEELGFAKHFGALVGSGDAPKDKPDPAVVLQALQKSGLSPGEDVWFIGDSPTDMLCALNAGCLPILIQTKTAAEDLLAKHPPRHRFSTHRALLDFIISKIG